jgi:integrase
MARHRRPAPSGGRVFQRQSRHTGAPLATWWIAYYVDGKERRESAHSADLEVAQRLLRTRLHAVDEGTFVGPERERLTVNAILDALLGFYAVQGHRSVASAGPTVKAWRPPLGACRALAVTTGRILRLTRAWQASGTSNATINRRLALLHRAYRLAKLHLDPARLDFTDCRLPECSPLGKHLSPEAFVALAEHLDVGRRALFEFCYLTGKRKGQMSRTMWAPHYNAETAEFTWNATEVKAKRPEVLPLAGRPRELIAALYAARRLHCRYVFHGPDCAAGAAPSIRYGCVGDFKRLWATACTKAGFPVGRKRGGYVFHNTRHTAVTNLVNAGVPAHEAMAVSGHQTRSVFDRYSLTLKAQTRAALERVTAYTAAHAAAPVVVPLAGARRRQRAVATDTLTDTPREERAKIRRRRTAKGAES